MTIRTTSCLLAAAAAVSLSTAAATAQDTVTVGSYGGAWGEAFVNAALDPIAEELGITIRKISYNSLSEVKLQVDAGAVEIDIANLAGSDCVVGDPQNLFEPLDYSVIDRSRVDASLARDNWIAGPTYYSTVLAYRTDAFGDEAPESWTDFWDVERFPGPRALWNYPVSMLEVALLADGVPGDDLYPLDIDRALEKLREIKPHVAVWWANGGQSAQLLADGEVDMLAIWNGRVSTVMQEGAPADFTYNQGLLGVDCLAVPRGSPNAALAMQVIDRILAPEIQANFPRYIDYGPVNTAAFEGDLMPAEMKAAVNSSPENLALQTIQNDDWWGENLAKVQPLWDQMLQE